MRRTALLAVPLALVAACGGDAEPRAAGSVAPEPSPSASAAAAPSATPTPTASAEAAPTATRERALDGDVDGDGEVDEISFEGHTLVVGLSGGGTARVSTDGEIDPNVEPTVAGVVDVERDGRADVFVRVAEGASTSSYRLFRYDGRQLRAVDRGGDPFLLTVGGTVTHGDGFSCTEDGRLVVRSAVSDEGTTFRVTTTTYALRGWAAEQLSRTTATGESGSDEVRRAYEVDCGSVGEGE